MLLRERKYNTCTSCKQHTTMACDESYGCDQCRKKIDMQKNGIEYLEATVFNHDDQTTRLQFCSWKCCLKKLKTVKCDHFVNLPFLHYDGGILAKEFFKLVKV